MFGLAEGVPLELVVEVLEVVGGLAERLLAEGAGVGLVQKFGVVVCEPGGVAGGHGGTAPVGDVRWEMSDGS